MTESTAGLPHDLRGLAMTRSVVIRSCRCDAILRRGCAAPQDDGGKAGTRRAEG